jgi:hypothetical protein
MDFLITPITHSPILRHFPWINGISGVQDKRHYLEGALQEVVPPHPQEVVNLVLVCCLRNLNLGHC